MEKQSIAAQLWSSDSSHITLIGLEVIRIQCAVHRCCVSQPATQGRLGQVQGMPCSNSVISGVTEAERYLLPLTLHQSLMVFPVRISLLLRSYYITNLGLDSNQHRHLAQCL